MHIKEQVDAFIAKLLTDPTLDLSVYKNHEFCEELVATALEEIRFMLFKMHITQLQDERKYGVFHLENVINLKHPLTQLSILDYCVIAGLDELAFRIASLGGKTNIDLRNFEEDLSEAFEEINSKIVYDLKSSMDRIANAKENALIAVQPHKSFWARCKEYISGSYKYPSLLLFSGIACLAAAPFSAGLTALIPLVSVGVSATIASVSSFQAAYTSEQGVNQRSDQNRIRYEAKELKELMQLVRETAEFLGHERLKNTHHNQDQALLNVEQQPTLSKKHLLINSANGKSSRFASIRAKLRSRIYYDCDS